ncbi:unnamed protein product [Caenorhabditis auriculariae]|uniref:PX domain-containing protein n=1 Tax=Caenorhabditis auriculariae TaxID=2777116 RepID=A0A8S1H1H1_9PELO|nr:unnamed protein product [Caenorhabditis auriculariae]
MLLTSSSRGFLLLCLANFFLAYASGSGGPTKGTYQVLDSSSNACIMLQADIKLFLTYYTKDGEKDVEVHVPTTSKVDTVVSSCNTYVRAGSLNVAAQLLRINFDHMDGWSMDIAFTQDPLFKTDKGTQYAMFAINVTANYASQPTLFPNARDPTQVYYLPLNTTYLSTISESIYAENGHSYYCPSRQKYDINKNAYYGPYAYVEFSLTYLQAFKTSRSKTFDQRETCSSDQHVTDLVPIIVGSILAGFIVLTLVVYLIYRSCLPEEVLNLVNPGSHFENEGMEEDKDSLKIKQKNFLEEGEEINLDADPVLSEERTDDDSLDETFVSTRTTVDDSARYVDADSSLDDRFASISPEPTNSHILIRVTDFEKRGEGMNAFIVYKIITRTEGIAGYANRDYIVWRRFSDFLGLHEKIVEKYLPKGIVVPVPPEKSFAAMTKTKTASNPLDSREVGLKRSRLLERFLKRLIQHPRIKGDCDVRDFLTLETDLPKAIQTSALSSAGMKRMIKSFGDVFTRMAFHMEEGDRWFEQAQSQVEELDESLRKFHQFSESLASSRKEYSICEEKLSKAMSMLASCEESTSLARALSHFTDTLEHASLLWARQAEADTAKLAESIGEYVSLIGSLKEVFEERVKAWQTWQNAQQTLTKKREQKARLELSGRNDRAEQMRAEIEETINKMDQLESAFSDLSKSIREEVVRFETERKQDLKNIFIEYLETIVRTQTEIRDLWKKFEPEAHRIQV